MHWPIFLFYCYGFICLIFGLLYLIIQFRIRQAWTELPEVNDDPNFSPQKKYSVIIAARNEAEHIHQCLSSILSCNFSAAHLEVLLIDDHSEDETAVIAKRIADPRLKILSAKGDGKKAALALGIAQSSGDWIITTDADCKFSEKTIPLLAQQAERGDFKFIAGTVLIHQANNWIERFQAMDVVGTMGVTAAGIQLKNAYLANGAHLAYPKAVFDEVNGFEGIDHYASGDDMMLLHKVAARYPEKIHFLKNNEAVVFTKAESNLSAFFRQRLRWASKGNAFKNSKTWWMMVIVFMNSFLACFSFLLALFGLKMIWPVMAYQWINKWTADSIVLQSVSSFYKKRLSGIGFLTGAIFHAWYISIIGLWSQIQKQYSWKGRRTK